MSARSLGMQQPSATPSGTFDIGGDLTDHRLGFGAMRLTGPGIWSDPVDLVDTADSYGPSVSEDLLREGLRPYRGVVVATKGGLTVRVAHLDENAAPANLRLGDDDASALDVAGAAAWAETNRRKA
jgi:hypothetical protein